MKTTLLTIIVFFAFTAFAVAQEEQDKTLRQPPLVTQAQVEKDAKLAQQERKKHEGNKAVKEENRKEEDKKATNTINSSSPKKTSTQPGKQ